MNAQNIDTTKRDTDLLQRLRHDDANALGEIVHAYAEWLVESAMRIVQSQDVSQDIVQDVFAWLWDARAQLQIQTSLPAYLYRAVANRAYNVIFRERTYHRVAQSIGEEQTRQQSESVASFHTTSSNDELKDRIDAALGLLQPRMRDVFLMRAEQEMSYEEIADAMGISVATAYKQMYRATRILADALANS